MTPERRAFEQIARLRGVVAERQEALGRGFKIGGCLPHSVAEFDALIREVFDRGDSTPDNVVDRVDVRLRENFGDS